MLNLILHELRVRRGTIIGWILGLGFFAILYMSFFPALPQEMLNLNLEEVEFYRGMGVMSMATFEGYMLSTVYNFLPLLVAIFGVVIGVGSLAGEEDSGTLELLAALPLSRAQLLLGKAAALALASFGVMLVVALLVLGVFLGLEDQIDTPITGPDLFWATLSSWLLALVFITLSLFFSAYLPNRLTALAASVVAVMVSFFGNNLAGMVESLEVIQPVLPNYYTARIVRMLSGEVVWNEMLALAGMALVFLVLALLSFQRRNLTIGAWPWQRARMGG
jgi:ABC-2 type transport system permease protein